MRCRGWRLPPASIFSGELSSAAARGVLVSEGAIQFTRTLLAAYSAARARVRPSTAALAVAMLV